MAYRGRGWGGVEQKPIQHSIHQFAPLSLVSDAVLEGNWARPVTLRLCVHSPHFSAFTTFQPQVRLQDGRTVPRNNQEEIWGKCILRVYFSLKMIILLLILLSEWSERIVQGR